MHKFFNRGMTAVEILVTISILALLALIVFPQFSKMRENEVLKTTTSDMTSALHNAQSRSLSSVNSGEFGVHFQSDKIIIFRGKTFSAGSPENKIINIMSPAFISDVSLGGVGASTGDLYFERLSGAPSKTGTVTISTSSLYKIITISATGTISVN